MGRPTLFKKGPLSPAERQRRRRKRLRREAKAAEREAKQAENRRKYQESKKEPAVFIQCSIPLPPRGSPVEELVEQVLDTLKAEEISVADFRAALDRRVS